MSKLHLSIVNMSKRFATSTRYTVDKRDVQHFETLSARWWDSDSPVKILHSMNSLRVPLVRDGLINTGVAKANFLNTEAPLTGLKIVDVGCGGGCLSEPLAKLGCNVIGIDASQDMITVAKEHASRDKMLQNLTYLATTIEEFASNNLGKFDAIVASEVLEHVLDQSIFLEECVKCIKPGGSIFITTINKTLRSKIFAIWFGENVARIIPKGTHEFEKFVSPETVERILKENNCRTKRVRGEFYNLFTNRWSWTNDVSIFYALHAVKNTFNIYNN